MNYSDTSPLSAIEINLIKARTDSEILNDTGSAYTICGYYGTTTSEYKGKLADVIIKNETTGESKSLCAENKSSASMEVSKSYEESSNIVSSCSSTIGTYSEESGSLGGSVSLGFSTGGSVFGVDFSATTEFTSSFENAWTSGRTNETTIS